MPMPQSSNRVEFSMHDLDDDGDGKPAQDDDVVCGQSTCLLLCAVDKTLSVRQNQELPSILEHETTCATCETNSRVDAKVTTIMASGRKTVQSHKYPLILLSLHTITMLPFSRSLNSEHTQSSQDTSYDSLPVQCVARRFCHKYHTAIFTL
jgi:hypothetical protein